MTTVRFWMLLGLVLCGALLVSCEDQQKNAMAGDMNGVFSSQPPACCTVAGKDMPAEKPGECCANVKCPMSGQKVDTAKATAAQVRQFEGQKVLFCCEGCAEKFDKLSKDEKRTAVKQCVPCVNTHCPMTGTRLDPAKVESDPGYRRDFRGHKVGFCCANCPEAWDKMSDQQKQQAVEKSTVRDVVNTHCPISGVAITAGMIQPNLVREFKGQKVAMCCQGCVAEWEKMSDAEKEAALKKVLPKQ